MSSRRRSILVALLATILGSLLTWSGPTQAAVDDPDLRVTIDTVSPSRLDDGSTVTMTGTVRNANQEAWTSVQAYLVIPGAPFTTRAQVDEVRSSSTAYAGVRVVETDLFAELGDLAPGETKPFRLSVPYDSLNITGAEGIYPVGVQILATDTEGIRSPDALARATTFLPKLSSTKDPVPTSLVWPFLMPDYRDARGAYVDPESFAASVGPGGQLRNLLDLAADTTSAGTTILLDPALLVGVDDLANGRRSDLDDAQRAQAATFLRDLLAFARGPHSLWVLDFDRPDVLAFSDNADISKPLEDVVERATRAALSTYQLSGRRVSWPTRNGVSTDLLRHVRGNGDSPVIVNPSAVPDWERRQGSLVQYETARGPVPLLVDDLTEGNVPGGESVTLVRQRLVTEAALASLERAFDPQSRADAVVMVEPSWDPGPQWAAGRLSDAFAAPFARGVGLDSILTQPLAAYEGDVSATARARPLSRTLLQVANDIVMKGQTLSSVISQSQQVDDALARDVAGVLGVRWRSDRPEALSIATARARLAGAELDKISIEAPPSVTLSSAKGGFPLTIRNDTDEAIRIGVDLDSSNPALAIPALDEVDVAAGERRTVTVQVDLGNQRTTFLTAHLMSDGGQQLGTSTTFKVRSSSIGVVLWVAMGAAGALMLLAIVRRFHRRRSTTASALPPDGDD